MVTPHLLAKEDRGENLSAPFGIPRKETKSLGNTISNAPSLRLMKLSIPIKNERLMENPIEMDPGNWTVR